MLQTKYDLAPLSSNELSPKENLRAVIQDLVDYMESQKGKSCAIVDLSQRFMIKRRRLYDIINVFVSLGCCKKTNYDQILWLGKEMINNEIVLLIEKRLSNRKMELSDLFPASGCIGIANLTISFILLFHALKVDHLDLRYAARLFSLNTTRYKTTLCKLYQICFILGAFGITSRSPHVCEVVLIKTIELFKNEKSLINDEDNCPLSISKLLNRPL